MAMSGRRFVLVEVIVKILFEVLNAEWLQDMWERSDKDAQHELIDVIYLIYMVKTGY